MLRHAPTRGGASWLARVVEHQRIGWDLALITVQAHEPIPYCPANTSVSRPHSGGSGATCPGEPTRPDGLLRFPVRAADGRRLSPALVAETPVDDDIVAVLERPHGGTERGTVDAVLQNGPWVDCDVVVSGSPAMPKPPSNLTSAGIPVRPHQPRPSDHYSLQGLRIGRRCTVRDRQGAGALGPDRICMPGRRRCTVR